jgi:photosystem II stability/assembly factor-like uncharacterized protein
MRLRGWPVGLVVFGICATNCGSQAADGGMRPQEGGTSSQNDGGSVNSTGGGLDATPAVDAPRSVPAEAAAPPPPDPCIEAGTCPLGTWIDVTPPSIAANFISGGCGEFGPDAVQVDPMHPSNLYTQFNCQGVWKSTDYGQTWTGPINTGTGGAMVGDSGGGITMAPHDTAEPPVIFWSGIRGDAVGFWKSVDGGVSWTNYPVAAATPGRQDLYPCVVDPYDAQHLLITGHEQAVLGESTNGGLTWTADTAPDPDGGSGEVFFIDTGVASTTRTTWLWINDSNGGGTLRTTDGGTTWKQVDLNDHPHALSQIYQPDNTSGVVYMAGVYSAEGYGVLRSQDYGQTWALAGLNMNETIVFGTPTNIYASYGWAAGAGSIVAPDFEIGAQPGTGTWTSVATPTAMTQGATQAAVTYDGAHYVFVTANFSAGVWRYVEP